jgi:hypothetical protein
LGGGEIDMKAGACGRGRGDAAIMKGRVKGVSADWQQAAPSSLPPSLHTSFPPHKTALISWRRRGGVRAAAAATEGQEGCSSAIPS